MEGTLKTQTTYRAFQDVELRLAVRRTGQNVSSPVRGGGGAVRALELLHGLAVPARMIDFDKRAVDRDLGNLQAAAGKGCLVDAPRLSAAVQRRPPEATPLEAVAERI